jgi:hypothetical protein
MWVLANAAGATIVMEKGFCLAVVRIVSILYGTETPVLDRICEPWSIAVEKREGTITGR